MVEEEETETIKPSLTTPGDIFYVRNALSKCHKTRIGAFTYVLNIGVFTVFVFIVAIVLWMCWKNRLSPAETYQKMIREQEMVLSKIRFYKDHQRYKLAREHSPITGLPTTDLRPV